MTTTQRFQVYNASAGSGKTFQIAKEYLSKILVSNDKSYIYRLLGITFTNKAAGEMKRRIIQNLIQASQGEIKDVMQTVAAEIRQEIESQTGAVDDATYRNEIISRSKKRLSEILHYYDEFQLTTIDKMMYKIIRTFARDMQLPADMEVVLEYKEVVDNLIDKIINQARQGDALTRFLIDFAKRKADDGKFWDVKADLSNISGVIFDDNYYDEILSIANKTFADFKTLQSNLFAKRKHLTKDFQDKYCKEIQAILTRYDEALLKAYLQRLELICHKDFKLNQIGFTDKMLDNIEGEAIFVKKAYNDAAHLEVNGRLASIFTEVIAQSEQYKLYDGLLKQINVLSIQSELLSEIEAYKLDNHSIFINDFNKLILEQILANLASDTPYIYMRLGEKYAHYFIDEFQDTSQLQWHNIIPLVKEALSKEFSENTLGDAMLVGDAKQSIYRFRGGRPEQFIALTDAENTTGEGNPFAEITAKSINRLPYNWRSLPNVIKFNNAFFKTFPDFLDTTYRSVYANPEQQIPGADTDEGFVQVQFLKNKNDNGEEKELFTEAVYQAVQQAVASGFNYEDICVLVNRHSQGVEIANLLLENNIEVVSSETLLVINAQKVRFLIHWLRFLHYNSDEDFFEILRFLVRKDDLDNQQVYTDADIQHKLHKKQRIDFLQQLGYSLDYEQLMSYNLYDLAVYLVDVFGLKNDAIEQAYLQSLMEEIYNFSLSGATGIVEFLTHWDRISEKLSINMPERLGAVKMMTVHASKGLEFPVVIYYAEGKILSNRDNENSVWIPVNPKEYNGFEYLPIAMKELKNNPNPVYQNIYRRASEEKKFDSINRLYVALTRAAEQLYVVLEPLSKTPKEVDVNQIFNLFLQKNAFENDGFIYKYGNPKRTTTHQTQSGESIHLPVLYYKNWQSKDEKLLKINTLSFERWQDDKKNAITYGMMLHDILASITTLSYWQKHQEKLLANLDTRDKEEVRQKIEAVLHHPDLQAYYTDAYEIINERSILIPDKQTYFVQKRPDRLVLKGNKISIIDYKTGEKHSYHQRQLDDYAGLLSSMGYIIGGKILVYIGEELEVVSSELDEG